MCKARQPTWGFYESLAEDDKVRIADADGDGKISIGNTARLDSPRRSSAKNAVMMTLSIEGELILNDVQKLNVSNLFLAKPAALNLHSSLRYQTFLLMHVGVALHLRE